MKATNELKKSVKQLCEIAEVAATLIRAMHKEVNSMPKQFQAPETCNAAGILLSRLQNCGFKFNEMKRGAK